MYKKMLEDLRIIVLANNRHIGIQQASRMDNLVSSVGPMPEKAERNVRSGIWGQSRSFLAHITMVVLVGLFMRFYVDGRSFFLSHTLSLMQADGSTIQETVVPPIQRDITTIISILASTARAASTLWIAGIDLRCIFLFMKRGGVTLEGLRSMFGRSLPGRRHFRQKTNFIIFAVLHGGIIASTYTSSILAGSVTWKTAKLYRPGSSITGIPLGQTGNPVYLTSSTKLLEAFVGYSAAVYYIFYGNPANSDSTSMHRLIPDDVGFLPNGSRFDDITVPYFAVDAFDWIRDPNSTLSSHQLNISTISNATDPRVMGLRKWGFIPKENWGPSEHTFPHPLVVSESRILVIWTDFTNSSKCVLDPTIPSYVQPYMAPFGNVTDSSCFIFANVTYRAGAARSGRCQMWGPGVIKDTGDVRDLQLVEDSVTSVALALAPYLATALVETDYALPAFPSQETAFIELLSRSYQVAWNSLTMRYGVVNETSNVMIAVDASTASVLMWRVAVWGALHGILVVFGVVFRYLHTRGRYPWIEDPVTAALLVDPTILMNDKRTWAGEDPPHMAGMLKLEQKGTSTYLVLEDPNAENKV